MKMIEKIEIEVKAGAQAIQVPENSEILRVGPDFKDKSAWFVWVRYRQIDKDEPPVERKLYLAVKDQAHSDTHLYIGTFFWGPEKMEIHAFESIGD